MPEDHRLALVASRNRAQREADVVVAVGTRANWLNGHLRPPRFAVDARFIVANIDADEIGRGPEVGVVAHAGVFLTTLVQDVSTALDPSASTSILDPSAIAGLGTLFDPAVIADIGTLLDTSLILDIYGMLPSLMS